MQKLTAMKNFCAVISIILLLSTFTIAAPSYSDYDNNIRDLLEVLMQREALEEGMAGHQMVRKAVRPSLRLRFGKRFDSSSLPVSAIMAIQPMEN